MSSLFDDEDEWQDMPVILPSHTGLDEEDKKMYHWTAAAAPHALRESTAPTSTASALAGGAGSGNATGRLVDFDAAGHEWREKERLDEMDYTRLELDDDPEEDEVSMRTQYLFNEDKGMTPLAQMQATKTLLTEGQRIAYVGLCRLVAREMVQTLKIAARGAKELEPATESAQNWSNKIMGRLYRHMEVDAAEQRMIDQLAEHGVTADDLVPSLVTTHEVDNPEYDPEAPKEDATKSEASEALEVDRDQAEQEQRRHHQEDSKLASERQWESERKREAEETAQEMRVIEDKVQRMELEQQGSSSKSPLRTRPTVNPFGDDEDENGEISTPVAKRTIERIIVATPSMRGSAFDEADEEGDIGGVASTPISHLAPDSATTPMRGTIPTGEDPTTPTAPSRTSPTATSPLPEESANLFTPLPSTLPGVSTHLTPADKTITLDIRWTILCDLFLSLIADSVYDARSRVLLGRIAAKLGLDWIDVVRFERRLTEALEIQEGVQQKEHDDILEDKRKQGKKQRYLMMGLATLGGGLVIGLSAGLLAPVIGAGLGAAFTTIGVTGTTGFLAGAGGAAVVTSGGIVSGSYIGGKAMGKRTRHVKTFEFQPLHNNKRVNFFIAVPGFMSGPLDDVRLPFSTIDPVMGDLFAVLWEPDMMGDTGNALKILTSEVLTQVGQQVLAMTVMTALLSALQWPMMLTKLGYLIDNPWSNALDRARQAGAVLADILMNRHMGVRPVSLIGFSLGARVIFYALVELAKAKAFGVVQEVYLFGATLTAPKKVWRQVRGVVAGRFVNAYAMNDWVLGYLFRATSGGLNTVAGLRPIEHVPDLENVDITDMLVGHMSYRTLMPSLLAHVGFKTTADHFDEPEDMHAPEREVISKEEEAERQIKKERSKMGLFEKLKRPKSNNASASDLHAKSQSTASSVVDDDELPPRLNSHEPLPAYQGRSSESFTDAPSTTPSSPTLQKTELPEDQERFDIAKLMAEVSQISRQPEDEFPAPGPQQPWSTELKSTALDRSAVSLQDSWTTTASTAAPTPRDQHAFTAPDRAASAADFRSPPTTFAFGGADGDMSWSEADERNAQGKNSFDAAPDPASSSFAWGRPSSSSVRDSNQSQNPW